MRGRSRLDILCEVLTDLKDNGKTPYDIMINLRLNYQTTKACLVLLEKHNLVEGMWSTMANPLIPRWHYTKWVYKTTSEGLEIVDAWIKIKNHLHIWKCKT
jgi:predicted transcriptional regulator